MDTNTKNYIFLLTTHLVLGLIGYSYRQYFKSMLYDLEIGSLEENGLWRNRTRILPYEEQLPAGNPDVLSPIYLIQLAKFEAFIFNLLTDFEKESARDLHPILLENIQL